MLGLLLGISIHAAREGGDVGGIAVVGGVAISIHAAREGGDNRDTVFAVGGGISIHAAREGGDVQVVRCKDCPYFISIHAAREGGDRCRCQNPQPEPHFNPRRP